MKWVNLLVVSLTIVIGGVSPAWGNPSMPPPHPGCQWKGIIFGA